MKGKTITFMTRYGSQLQDMFSDLIQEKTEKMLSMSAGEARDLQIEFVKAFKEWSLVLKQVGKKDDKKKEPEKIDSFI